MSGQRRINKLRALALACACALSSRALGVNTWLALWRYCSHAITITRCDLNIESCLFASSHYVSRLICVGGFLRFRPHRLRDRLFSVILRRDRERSLVLIAFAFLERGSGGTNLNLEIELRPERISFVKHIDLLRCWV